MTNKATSGHHASPSDTKCEAERLPSVHKKTRPLELAHFGSLAGRFTSSFVGDVFSLKIIKRQRGKMRWLTKLSGNNVGSSMRFSGDKEKKMQEQKKKTSGMPRPNLGRRVH